MWVRLRARAQCRTPSPTFELGAKEVVNAGQLAVFDLETRSN
jgi:hypothetical protein